MLCHFGRRQDQLLIEFGQQSLLYESWCRQTRDRGHVNSFHFSPLHKESPCSPPGKAPSPPLPKSMILPPALPPPPSFSLTKNERHSLYSPSLHLLAVVFLAPPNSKKCPTSFVLFDYLPAPFSHPLFSFRPIQVNPLLALHQCSTCLILCLQWMLTRPFLSCDTYSTKSRGSIRPCRSRGAGVSGGARLTISAAGTKGSLK